MEDIHVPPDLAQVAEEKGIPLDLMRRALALGFPADIVKQQLQMPGVTAEATEQYISEQERIRAGGQINVPPELAEIAAKYGWPESVLKRALALGANTAMLTKQMEAGVTAEQAEAFIERQEMARRGEPEKELDLRWMKVPTEWGVRARPGKKGLTVGLLNAGSYGDVPDYWPHRTEMPRGAHPLPGIPAMGYSIFEKAELWADNAADLYEEAIQRRWRPATDIPWETVEPLPDEIERAMCQVCTYVCEKALVAGDIVGRWLPEMSYGYHEIKLFMASTEFDSARQFEVFRKRAMSNGGGMGVQSPGLYNRAMIDGRTWTEASLVLHVLSNSFLLGIYELGEYVAHNEAESKIFGLCMQDASRQIAYGVQHLKHFLSRYPERRPEAHAYLNKAEAVFVREQKSDTPLREALIILLGGGLEKDQLRAGVARLEDFTRRWVRDYVARLAAAGIPERAENLNDELRKYVQQDVATAA